MNARPTTHICKNQPIKMAGFSQIAGFFFFCYDFDMTVESIKKKIVPILKRQGVLKAAVFGSAARGEMNKHSDIDLLLKISNSKTFFDLINLKLELEEKLGHSVDIVEYGAIHPLIKSSVLKQQKKIYEKKF